MFSLPVREDLEDEFGASAVEFEVAQFVEAAQVDAAGGRWSWTGARRRRLDQLVDQGGDGGVADPVAGFRGRCSQSDQQM
jgi:hypothetical protein